VTSFEPFTLLSALSQVTERIGLVATGSTASDTRAALRLDHILATALAGISSPLPIRTLQREAQNCIGWKCDDGLCIVDAL